MLPSCRAGTMRAQRGIERDGEQGSGSEGRSGIDRNGADLGRLYGSRGLG